MDNFSKNVFHDGMMRERLPKNVYMNLKKAIQEGNSLTLELADAVAQGMKECAIGQSPKALHTIPTGFSRLRESRRKNMRLF